MRKIAFLLLLLLPASASTQNVSQKTATSIFAKDVTGTSYTYCKLVGNNTDPFGTAYVGPGTIKTTGSSTTVDEAVAGTNPFAEVAVGDLLVIQVGSTVYRRAVTARASAAQITVDTAITLSGNAWSWYRQLCGTAATDGWFDASAAYQINVVTDVATINAASIDVSIECRAGGSTTTVGTRAITGTGVYSDILLAVVWEDCRVGYKLTTDSGAQNVTAYYVLQKLGG